MEYRSLYLGFLGLIALLLWALDYWKIFQKAQLYVPKSLRPSRGFKLFRLINFILGVISWLLISYAMSGPRKALKFSPNNIKVNDIYLVLDVSRSMLADDLVPNRLEVAKKKLRDFAALRPTDRLGVILFSEKVYTLLPLTTDPDLISKVLEEIRIGKLGSGTNIGDALALAVARGQASKTKNKVIILLTDGVNNVGNMDPVQAAKLAKDYNIKVYTIGLGGQASAKIPMGKGIFGNQFQAIPGGSIDTKTLKEISDLTGGKMFLADNEESLREILDEIQKLEKTKVKFNNQVVYEEFFFIYLLYGVIFFILHNLLRRFVTKEVL